jgi:hypothetical protein
MFMRHEGLNWEHNLPTTLERASRERRFVLVDFSKDP